MKSVQPLVTRSRSRIQSERIPETTVQEQGSGSVSVQRLDGADIVHSPRRRTGSSGDLLEGFFSPALATNGPGGTSHWVPSPFTRYATGLDSPLATNLDYNLTSPFSPGFALTTSKTATSHGDSVSRADVSANDRKSGRTSAPLFSPLSSPKLDMDLEYFDSR